MFTTMPFKSDVFGDAHCFSEHKAALPCGTPFAFRRLVKACGIALFTLGMLPLHSSWAGTTNAGSSYVLDCTDGTVIRQILSNASGYTVQIQNCAYWLASGAGISPTGNSYNGGVTTNYIVSAGAIGKIEGYNAGSSPAGALQSLTFVQPNVAPVFVGAATSLNIPYSASATDIKSLLHVSDSNTSQTETWSQSAAPSHGTLSFSSATASSGSSDITPGGTITYTPTAGYAGADSFTVQVSDGTATATRTINVTVAPPTITVGSLTLNSMTTGSVYVSQSFVAVGGSGTYQYGVSAGALPAGLTLNAASGALSGTPTSAGAYNFTVQATDTSSGTGPFSATRSFSATVSAPAAPPIPLSVAAPAIGGIPTRPTALDLSSGNGPAMTVCLRDALRPVLGANAVYQGQAADGSARIGSTGQVASFYVLDANADIQQQGISLSTGNPMNVFTSCGTFTTVPALHSLTEFGSVISAMGLTAQINPQGVITLSDGGLTYVARPDYLVTLGTAGAPSLTKGSDGLFRFSDSAGNVQILRPAFLEPAILSNQLSQMGGSMTVQTDGTALFTPATGPQYVLTPDLTLSVIPAANTSMAWWQDSATHYLLRIYTRLMSQGLTAKAR